MHIMSTHLDEPLLTPSPVPLPLGADWPTSVECDEARGHQRPIATSSVHSAVSLDGDGERARLRERFRVRG